MALNAMLISLLALPLLMQGARQESKNALNPILKVASMHQEGEKEKALYEKFMCYCKTSSGSLQSTISEAET